MSRSIYLPRKRGFLRTASLDVYGLKAALGQPVRRKSVATSLFHMKTVLELSPRGPLARVGSIFAIRQRRRSKFYGC